MEVKACLILLSTCLGAVSGYFKGCHKPTDLVFLLDGSFSVSADNWLKEISVTESIVDSLGIKPDVIRVGVVVFSKEIEHVINLKPSIENAQFKILLNKLKQPGEDTDMAKGIARVREMFTSDGRHGVPQIAVVLTDGLSDNSSDTIQEAMAAKSDGIVIKVVAIGQYIDLTELKAIVTSEEDLFEVSDSESLPQLKKDLAISICGACKPTLQYAAKNSYLKKQEKGAKVEVTNVSLNNESRFVFNGQSSINIQSLAAGAIGTQLFISITYKKAFVPILSTDPIYSQQRNQFQSLISNCEPWWYGKKPSIWIFVASNTVKIGVTTEKDPHPVTMTLSADREFNTVTLQYNGAYLLVKVNDVERIRPLTGDIERREAGMALGQCSGFPSFVGELDAFEISECLPFNTYDFTPTTAASTPAASTPPTTAASTPAASTPPTTAASTPPTTAASTPAASTPTAASMPAASTPPTTAASTPAASTPTAASTPAASTPTTASTPAASTPTTTTASTPTTT